MIYSIFLTFFLTSLTFFSHAIEVPQEIENQMQLRVEQGICQNEWINETSLAKVFKTKSSMQKIIATPCSLWSHNQAWSLFLVIKTGADKELIKPLFFMRYSSFKGLYADSVLENISWDEENQTLTSRKYLNGRPSCGELAGYKWNVNNQDFKTLSIYKNDDCNIIDKPWLKVF